MKVESGTFFKKCIVCRTISGFCLDKEAVEKDKKYFCHVCKIETKLSNWIKSNERDYIRLSLK